MKKKVLFIIGILDSGGVAKSILNLLNVIAYEKVDVSLLIVNTEGAFNKQVPSGIRVLSDQRLSALTSGIKGIRSLLSIHNRYFLQNWLLAFGSLLRMLLSVIDKGKAGLFLSKLMPKVTNDTYDLIVDYNGQHNLYYMVDKLNGLKKITFFHNDYRKWRFYEKIDRRYYARVDGIFTISDECVNALKEVFPEYSEKIRLMENITSPQLIRNLANMYVDDILLDKGYKIIIASLGHVCRRKGSDLAMQVALELKKRKIDFEWWFIGKVTDDWEYRRFIEKNELEKNIRFLGVKQNPYPYLKHADIYVHLSQFEGKSIALDEVKILCKPIVVTNFSTVYDQFEDGVNASICKMNVADATSKVLTLINDKKLQKRYIEYLSSHVRDNTTEINKIYNFLS